MKRILVAGVAAAGVMATASAQAALPGVTLFDQVNWGGVGAVYYTGEQFTESFVATGTETTLAFYGYDAEAAAPYVEDSDDITGISMAPAAGGANLLGETWSFTPAASGSDAEQYWDGWGTGTNGLAFGGTTPGDFDEYYQTVATKAGQTYDLSFYFQGLGTPSEVVVTANPGVAVPEPATWTLALVGFGVAGAALRSRRRMVVVG